MGYVQEMVLVVRHERNVMKPGGCSNPTIGGVDVMPTRAGFQARLRIVSLPLPARR